MNPLLGRTYIGMDLEAIGSRKNLKLDKGEVIVMRILCCDTESNTDKVPGGIVNLTLGWPLKV